MVNLIVAVVAKQIAVYNVLMDVQVVIQLALMVVLRAPVVAARLVHHVVHHVVVRLVHQPVDQVAVIVHRHVLLIAVMCVKNKLPCRVTRVVQHARLWRLIIGVRVHRLVEMMVPRRQMGL